MGKPGEGSGAVDARLGGARSLIKVLDVESLYREHLSDADLRLLGRVISEPDGSGGVVGALGMPALEEAVFAAPQNAAEPFSLCSPFLAFAVAVHRTAERLRSASFFEERFGPRSTIPVFGVDALREVLETPLRRYLLVELLASYTHVASGVVWSRTSRGWQRRRFSELDPGRLAGLLEVVESSERPGIYRRLGDLTLFLTGVFPDHAASFGGGAAGARVLRLAGVPLTEAEEMSGVDLLEHLGARWYRLAISALKSLGAAPTSTVEAVAELAERFADARRVLNIVTDNYLFPLRERWFGPT